MARSDSVYDSRPLLVVKTASRIEKAAVKKVSKGPYIKLSDRVLDRLSPKCRMDGDTDKYGCDPCSRDLGFNNVECHAGFIYELGKRRNGKSTLELVIGRDRVIINPEGATARDWMLRLVQPCDFEALERAWGAYSVPAAIRERTVKITPRRIKGRDGNTYDEL